MRMNLSEINDLVIAYGNLMFDCGAWDEEDGTSYDDLMRRTTEAKRALMNAVAEAPRSE